MNIVNLGMKGNLGMNNILKKYWNRQRTKRYLWWEKIVNRDLNISFVFCLQIIFCMDRRVWVRGNYTETTITQVDQTEKRGVKRQHEESSLILGLPWKESGLDIFPRWVELRISVNSLSIGRLVLWTEFCILSKFIFWNPNVQCDGIWVLGLWVETSWWD